MTDSTNVTTPESPPPGEAAAESSGLPIGKIAIAVVAVGALVLLGRQAAGLIQDFTVWVESLGALGPIVFVAGYAIAVAALIPGSLLTLAGGAIFGLLEGTAYVFLGASLGATGGFLIARYLARGFVEKRIEGNDRFAAVDRAVAENGLKITTLLRLSPAFPFSFLNYALGLTRVSLRDYLIACIGMLPGTFLYVYYGKVVGDVAALADSGTPQGGAEQTIFTVVGLVATIAVTVVVTRIARKALAEATDEPAAG